MPLAEPRGRFTETRRSYRGIVTWQIESPAVSALARASGVSEEDEGTRCKNEGCHIFCQSNCGLVFKKLNILSSYHEIKVVDLLAR